MACALVDTVSGLAERDARLAKIATMLEDADADADILGLRVSRLPPAQAALEPPA